MRTPDRATAGALGLVVAAALGLGGCGSGTGGARSAPANTAALPTAVAQALQARTPVDPAIVTADNQFGLQLLDALITEGGAANIAISPLSAAMALQILGNGAAGPTQQAMLGTLDLAPLGIAAVNTDNAVLQASLVNPDPQMQILIANSVWLDQSGGPVLPSFTLMDQTYYGATVGDLSGAPADVNAWVAAQTAGLITNLLPAGQYVDAIIANVVYFKGEWSSAFDPAMTTAAPFSVINGAQTTAQLMHQTGLFGYAAGTLHNAAFQALRLPYGKGRFSLLLVLPQAGVDVAGFVGQLTAADVNGLVAQLQTDLVAVALPKFKASYGASLTTALTGLGMGLAFGPAADFSALAPGFRPNVVQHQTVIEVDETGTVATGATGGGETTAVPQSVTMTLDHPFFYAIRDDSTGLLPFVGVLMNPS